MHPVTKTDVLIVGAGAAGLMCAIEAGKRGRHVVVVDHAADPGEKIRISGGGRCNFTNKNAGPANYISKNPHFCKSALKRYTPSDFIKQVDSHGISHHEKKLGQLFCDGSARQIVEMLKKEALNAGVIFELSTSVTDYTKTADGFEIATSNGVFETTALVVACGGLSIPKMGATGLGYQIAEHFGHALVPTRAGLVPLTFTPDLLAQTEALSGLSVDPVEVKAASGAVFREALLFTHRGLSGPAILQISSYWNHGERVEVNLLPDVDLLAALKAARTAQAKQLLPTVLAAYLPRRLADFFANLSGYAESRMADLSDAKLQAITATLTKWQVMPAGSEGYRTAEVTIGGVDTTQLSSKTMESQLVKGLYFVGEVMDVTGWLGGYNFQWAWSSGWSAGQVA